jgi:hypothetical protein
MRVLLGLSVTGVFAAAKAEQCVKNVGLEIKVRGK